MKLDANLKSSTVSQQARLDTSRTADTSAESAGMSAKDSIRFKGNMAIMEGPEKAEYRTLFKEMLAAKVLLGKLGNEQAVRNKRLEELAKKAQAKANALKPAWVNKATRV